MTSGLTRGLTVLTALVLLASCSSNRGAFLLVNKATEPIAVATIKINEQTIELRNIQPNMSAAGSYKVRTDGHYKIQVTFESGRTLNKELGYVTHGMDFQHEITVSDSDIEITGSKVN